MSSTDGQEIDTLEEEEVEDAEEGCSQEEKVGGVLERIIEEEEPPNVASILIPTTLNLKVAGLILKNNFNKLGCVSIYAALVLLVQWGWAAKFTYVAYDNDSKFGPQLITKVMLNYFYGQVCILSVVFMVSMYRNFHKYCTLWNDYKVEYKGSDAHRMRSFATKITGIFNVAFILLAAVFNFYFLFHPFDMMQHLPKPLFNEWPVPFYVLLPVMILATFIIYIWTQPVFFLTVVIVLLRMEFKDLTRDFRFVTLPPQDHFDVVKRDSHFLHVEDFRRRHLALTRLARKLDGMMSMTLMLAYMTDIILVMAYFFVIIFIPTHGSLWDEGAYHLIITCAITLVVLGGHLIAMTLCGSMLSRAPYFMKQAILDLDTRNLNAQQSFSLQMFLSRLDHDYVGLTIWRMVRIDRPIMFTVFALVLSYVVLMVKFGIMITHKKEEELHSFSAASDAFFESTKSTPFEPNFNHTGL